jgi:endonuclease/exonuclease/phosphatase family metal-dependent hydrolase
MGRGSESGWVNVTNDGEGSIRNSPTGTRYTYYWKLTKDIDLSNLESPSLEVKYHFKGHSYDYFRVQVGEEGARRLSDFTVLHEATEASAAPTEISLDLSEYTGQRVRVQFILRKPYNVVERRIGLYLHRAAILTPVELGDLDEQPGELRVSAFNVQVFGLSKMDKPEVVEALTQIITRFDLVMVQEVRDISETAIFELLETINAASSYSYEIFLSERLGRTSSKEQMAYLYRSDKLRFIEGATVADPMDIFERPPVWTKFEYIESASAINILGSHLDPDAVPTEIEALYNEFARYQLDAAEGESVLVMGDFNAGCRYLTDDELAVTTLFQTENLISLISDDVDTTTTSTYCPYDRMLVGGAMMNESLESGVFYFDQALGLTGEVTRSVSDHYPVWARFDMSSLSAEDGMMEMTP